VDGHRVQIDIRVPVGPPIPDVVDFIARCEDAGLDGVGVPDHPHRARDVYMTLAVAAARTRRLRLYPATSSPVVRHPLLLASAAHSLEEIAHPLIDCLRWVFIRWVAHQLLLECLMKGIERMLVGSGGIPRFRMLKSKQRRDS